MQPAKADVERHRQDWNRFIKLSTWSTVGVILVLAILWFTLA
ncbi:MAG: aa3-type cytochrome c oxidase subunit IV [Alphaproteobacteria bacterium]